jgi:hypothetical protein
MGKSASPAEAEGGPMAGSPWVCERCDCVNDAGARMCRVCGEPVPPPRSSRARALWVLLILVLVAAVAVGATLLIDSRHRVPAAPAAQLPVYSTPMDPSSTNAVTTTAAVPSSTSSLAGSVEPSCPAAAAQFLPGGAGTALLLAQTAKSVVTVCQSADGRLFYDGQARGEATSDATHITLPAQRLDGGFVAVNGDYHYTISDGRLVVSVGAQVLSDDALTPIG